MLCTGQCAHRPTGRTRCASGRKTGYPEVDFKPPAKSGYRQLRLPASCSFPKPRFSVISGEPKYNLPMNGRVGVVLLLGSSATCCRAQATPVDISRSQLQAVIGLPLSQAVNAT